MPFPFLTKMPPPLMRVVWFWWFFFSKRRRYRSVFFLPCSNSAWEQGNIHQIFLNKIFITFDFFWSNFSLKKVLSCQSSPVFFLREKKRLQWKISNICRFWPKKKVPIKIYENRQKSGRENHFCLWKIMRKSHPWKINPAQDNNRKKHPWKEKGTREKTGATKK